MKKLFLILLAAIPMITVAQNKRVVLDSIGNHGLIIHDSIITGLDWKEAYRYEAEMKKSGWRLPTPKEQKDIFEKTLDPSRSYGIIPSGRYFSSKFSVQPDNDTIPYIGRMTGRYVLYLGDGAYNSKGFFSLFLVKPF